MNPVRRRSLTWYLGALSLLVVLACAAPPEGEGAYEQPATQSAAPVAPGDGEFPCPPASITSVLAEIPTDFSGIIGQGNIDLYSWLTFVAMNWPADAGTCSADTSQTILSGIGPVVWESYLQDGDVFVAPGDQPSAWCPQPGRLFQQRLAATPPASREAVSASGVERFMRQNAKASPAVAESLGSIDEAVGGVLTDQNGRFVRFEIHLNEDEYRYVVDPAHQLWSQDGQRTFSGDIDFPAGKTSYGPTGAMEIKAAWKVLCESGDPGCVKPDDASRFYTVEAVVFNNAAGAPSPGKVPVTLGLVGLHIIHKTVSQPSWLWSTFEQVDNISHSFHDPDCPEAECPPNKQTAPDPATELNPDGTPINKPVQVVRITDIEESGASCQQDPPPSLNSYFQKLLQGSVWEHYQLISTNWIGEFGNTPKPDPIANVTLETYIQDATCIGCHQGATLAVDKRSADFSFLLRGAQ